MNNNVAHVRLTFGHVREARVTRDIFIDIDNIGDTHIQLDLSTFPTSPYDNIVIDKKGLLQILGIDTSRFDEYIRYKAKISKGINNNGINNMGNYNIGTSNVGDYNTGHDNTDNDNIGWDNTGHTNVGDSNSGSSNRGHCNSGNNNFGRFNSGDANMGECNSGNYNVGNYNSGHYNIASYNAGLFNTIDGKLWLFNKETDISFDEWHNSKAYNILRSVSYDGMLNKKSIAEWWSDLDEDDRREILEIPNFDKDIFFEITGIEV